ncbi:hypothetical protein FKM82_007347 [Ascaphus truei]
MPWHGQYSNSTVFVNNRKRFAYLSPSGNVPASARLSQELLTLFQHSSLSSFSHTASARLCQQLLSQSDNFFNSLW